MVRTLSVVCSLVLHVCFAVLCGILVPGIGGRDYVAMQKLLDVTLHSAREEIRRTQPQTPAGLPGQSLAPNRNKQQQPVKLISPVKRDTLLLGQQERLSQKTKERIYFGNGVLKQGNEVRLSLRAIGAMDFDKKDFYGTYAMSGEDLVLEIKPWGEELILEIPKLKLRRPLKRVGKFIWTYGPSFSESEPVEGSVTFFPHQKGPTSLPSRVMWMAKTPPMHIGVMQDWK